MVLPKKPSRKLLSMSNVDSTIDARIEVKNSATSKNFCHCVVLLLRTSSMPMTAQHFKKLSVQIFDEKHSWKVTLILRRQSKDKKEQKKEKHPANVRRETPTLIWHLKFRINGKYS
uniref:Uncharacterized protein n=1 Tax=Romanomermis culicivorax TaxID=13658 RepID=A0A915KXG1_ROMCU